VLVLPGTYVENLRITRDVTVRSAGGPAVTVIDGSAPAVPDSGSVVWMSAGTIRGFDLRNGTGTAVTYEPGLKAGGGILVYFRVLNEWPDVTIRDNWIHANRITAPRGEGAGIAAYFGRADIAGNRLFDNRIESPQTGSGAAMYLERWNYIDPYVVERNEIFDNHVLLGSTGAVRSDDGIRNNVLACNSVTTATGTGSAALSTFGETSVESNTVVANWCGNDCAAVSLYVESPQTMMIRGNNISLNLGAGLRCRQDRHPGTFLFECNNFFGNSGGQIVGDCTDVIGTAGNISLDPLFGRGGFPCQAGDWCLEADSPLLPENSPPGCGLIGALGLCTPVAVPEDEANATGYLRALPPRPNPFIERTMIAFHLPAPGAVAISIYGVLGRKVRTLAAGALPAGENELAWDGRGDDGRPAAGGAYVAVIRSGGREVTRTLLLVR
jgi:hypothetical protein